MATYQYFFNLLLFRVRVRIRRQAQLSLSKGGLGLRSLVLHAPAAYIASVCSSGYGHQSHTHLAHAVEIFNTCVAPSDLISLDSILTSPLRQRALSSKLVAWLRHFRWLTVFPLPRFHPRSPRPPCYHMQTRGSCCTSS